MRCESGHDPQRTAASRPRLGACSCRHAAHRSCANCGRDRRTTTARPRDRRRRRHRRRRARRRSRDDLAAVFREARSRGVPGVDRRLPPARAPSATRGAATPPRALPRLVRLPHVPPGADRPFRMAGSTGFQTAALDVARDAHRARGWVTGQPDARAHRRRRVPEPAGAARALELLDLARGALGCRVRTSRRTRRPQRGRRDALANRTVPGGQELYFAEANPPRIRGALVDNTDPEHPRRIFADSC